MSNKTKLAQEIGHVFKEIYHEPHNRYTDRGTGKTFRAVMKGLHEASLGKSVHIITANRGAREHAFIIAMDALGEDAKDIAFVRGSKVQFPNLGRLEFWSLDGLSLHSFMGKREDLLILDIPDDL